VTRSCAPFPSCPVLWWEATSPSCTRRRPPSIKRTPAPSRNLAIRCGMPLRWASRRDTASRVHTTGTCRGLWARSIVPSAGTSCWRTARESKTRAGNAPCCVAAATRSCTARWASKARLSGAPMAVGWRLGCQQSTRLPQRTSAASVLRLLCCRRSTRRLGASHWLLDSLSPPRGRCLSPRPRRLCGLARERCAQQRRVRRHRCGAHRTCATPLLPTSHGRPRRGHAPRGTIGDEAGACPCAHVSSITLLQNAVQSYEKTYDTATAAKDSPG